MDALTKLLTSRDWLLADGATGTELFNMGLQSGDAPELWNADHPDRIRALYQGPVDAGSDIFLTNSFGGNASRLKLHDAQSRVFELNKLAAEIARDVADWVETISAPEEMKAAAAGIALTGMPWCGTMSFDTAGRTMMGVTAPALAAQMDRLKHPPLAFGANCGVGASDLLRTVLGFGETPKHVIAKGNAGIPKYHDGHIHYDGTPALMADYAVLARDAGARIIGGCCGTTPEHLRHMRAALETRAPGPKPSLDQISQALGGFSSESDGTDGAGPTRTRRNARRKRASA